MKFISTITLSMFVGLTCIQGQMVSSEGPCQLESVFNECVERGKLFLNYCAPDDAVCLCRKNQDILICFQRCYSNDSRYSQFKKGADDHCVKVPESQKNQTLIIPPAVSGTNSSESARPTSSSASSTSSSSASDASSTSSTSSASTIIVSRSKSNSSSSSSSGAGENSKLTPISFVTFLALIFL